MNRMNLVEIGWLAGIVEGEGHLSCARGTTQLTVAMCDEDIIRKLHLVTGVGSVKFSNRKTKNPHHSDAWFWKVSNRVDVMHICASITPLLGERRRSKVLELANQVLASKNASQYDRACRQGHRFEQHGVMIQRVDGRVY